VLKLDENERSDDFDVLESLQIPQEIPTPDLNHYQIYEVNSLGILILIEGRQTAELEDEW